MARTTESQLSFADCEFRKQGVLLDPTLQAISDFLAEHAQMIEAVRGDLQRGLKKPQSGRRGMTPPQVLRSLIVMRIKNWDYRELRERIATDIACEGSRSSSAGRFPNTTPLIALSIA